MKYYVIFKNKLYKFKDKEAMNKFLTKDAESNHRSVGGFLKSAQAIGRELDKMKDKAIIIQGDVIIPSQEDYQKTVVTTMYKFILK